MRCSVAHLYRADVMGVRSGKAQLSRHSLQPAQKRLPIRAITDTWSCVTFVDDLVARTKEILQRRYYGIYQVVNEGACSYQDFGVECARLAKLSDEDRAALIELVTEREMKRIALRPRWTPMRCVLSKALGLTPMRGWQSALADYVK